MPALAISTYSFGPDADVRHVVKVGLDNDFSGLELGSFTYWPDTLSEKDISFIRDTVTRNEWAISIHFIHRGVNLGTRDPEARSRFVGQLQETVRLADRLGGRAIVVHLGHVTRSSPDVVIEARHEAYELALDSLKQCASVAENYGVYLCVENLYLKEPEVLLTYEVYLRLIETLASPFVRFTLDIGHANVYLGISEAIRQLGPYLRHIHIHDNDGESDGHREIGRGSIDFQDYKDFLKDFPYMIAFETRDTQDIEGAVVRSRKRLGDLLGL